tara:strand:+ start:9672 stop:10436 length:765 start_codon:yes stop_codon:yes gene_type:complete
MQNEEKDAKRIIFRAVRKWMFGLGILIFEGTFVIAQMPGMLPSLPVCTSEKYILTVHPESGGVQAWVIPKSARRFTMVLGMGSMTSRTQLEAMLIHSLPLSDDLTVAMGLGSAIASWSAGSVFSYDFPIYFQANRTCGEAADIAVFARIANRGSLLSIQDRGEFNGGIQWIRKHSHGEFVASWFWGHPSSGVHFQWSWMNAGGNAMRFRIQSLPFALGAEVGLKIGRHRQWIGVSHSNFIGMWLWNWQMDVWKG